MKYLIFFILLSCASTSQNLIQEGEVTLKGGQGEEKNWDTDLNFKRVSWYSELTMIFDLFYIDTEKAGEFKNWFSDFESRTVKQCQESLITFVYHLDDRRYSKETFFQSMRDQDYEVLEIPNFSSYLKLHPDFEELSFSLYDIKLLCRKKGSGMAKVIVPSYQAVSIKP